MKKGWRPRWRWIVRFYEATNQPEKARAWWQKAKSQQPDPVACCQNCESYPLENAKSLFSLREALTLLK